MPRKKAVENEAVLDEFDLSHAEEDSPLLDIEDLPEVEDDVQIRPLMTDPEWTAYVMSHFQDNEKNKDGHPYVSGLRRVARLLIGPILSSKAKVIQPAVYVGESKSRLDVATVEYEIAFACSQDTRHTSGSAYTVIYSDCAECSIYNTDPQFARFPVAMASTRAEGRCLRKALQLQGVVCAEEVTVVPVEESGVDGGIVPTQITFINSLCNRLKIDVMKYINSGKKKYKSIEFIDYGTADKMCEHLSELQRTNNVPKAFLKDEE